MQLQEYISEKQKAMDDAKKILSIIQQKKAGLKSYNSNFLSVRYRELEREILVLEDMYRDCIVQIKFLDNIIKRMEGKL